MGTQWWIFNGYKLPSTNNEKNTSKYAWNIKFHIITHLLTSCYGQQLVTMGTQLWIFNDYKLLSTNNELNTLKYVRNITLPVITH